MVNRKKSRGKNSKKRRSRSKAGMMKTSRSTRSSSNKSLPRWETTKEITLRENPSASENKKDKKLYGGQEFLVSETKTDKFNNRVFWKVGVNTRSEGHKEGWLKPIDSKGNWNVRTTTTNQLLKMGMIK